MPTKSLNLDISHLQYLEEYSETYEVSESEAARELLDKAIQNTELDSDTRDTPSSVGYLVQNGVCPWCDDYEGDHVAQHASTSHPESWEAHRE